MAIVYTAISDSVPIRVIVVGASGRCGPFSAYKMNDKWHSGSSQLSERDIARLYRNVSSDEFLNNCHVVAAFHSLFPEEAEDHHSREAIIDAEREKNPNWGTW